MDLADRVLIGRQRRACSGNLRVTVERARIGDAAGVALGMRWQLHRPWRPLRVQGIFDGWAFTFGRPRPFDAVIRVV
jgi:hypothetical protein